MAVANSPSEPSKMPTMRPAIAPSAGVHRRPDIAAGVGFSNRPGVLVGKLSCSSRARLMCVLDGAIVVAGADTSATVGAEVL